MGRTPSHRSATSGRRRPIVPEAGTRDPGYQAIRLRGLAGLIRASGERLSDLADHQEVAFFLASTLDEIAGALDGDD